MPSRRPRGAVVAGLTGLVLALVPATATALVRQPVSLGTGDKPNVTLEPSGTVADIAWTGRDPNNDQLFFCRWPIGSRNCSPLTQITAPGQSLSAPFAFTSGGQIHVISYRFGLPSGPPQTMMFSSADNGATFDAGVKVGDINPHDYAFGPGNTVLAATDADSCGLCFQAFPSDGTSASATALLSSDHGYEGTVGVTDGGSPISVFADASGNAQFRVFGGAGDINNAANWSPAVDIGVVGYPHLVSGPRGTFLIGLQGLISTPLQARKWTGSSFGTPVGISNETRADAAVEDPSGRIHVVGDLFTTKLFYASSDDGVTWDTEDVPWPGVPGAMRLAVDSTHVGAVVGTYQTNDTAGTVWGAVIGPRAESPTTTKFVTAAYVSGTVLVKTPGSPRFVALGLGDVIPVGSIVDTTHGRVNVTIALPNGQQQSSDFFQGIFRVTQAKNGLATMVLLGGNLRSCGRSAAVRGAKAKVIRQLWGSGTGHFATKGRFASATIRGTTWDTVDRCDGTLVKVTQGQVLVSDLKTHKKVVVKAGHSYLAKA